ncbi:hypothetical protein KFL_000400100 [Klebsormidium nitens]|uniref:PDZ domain-containing protein n=1 Tax=Klebsormidium nitens TaxID=105231 RepID=A0A1Y1HTJ9_KLENI|nr:hypothetical protein KFL_000400100 [Klebsormidium nitens]|eukprot:GAQ79867.1 hypothetical protein KFL_000400100 [Klebsormidium nitens]
MTQSNPREEALRLMDKRKLVEAEMDALMGRLTAPGMPGPAGSLLDKEGFPRADLDIPKIRADRHRLAVLKYDHTSLTKQVEEKMYAAFAIGARAESRTLPQKRPAEGAEDRQARTSTPSASPASESPSIPVQSSTDTPMTDANPSANPPVNPPASSPPLRPFAIVDEVTPGSPGDVDGLKLGDQLLRFGGVQAETPNVLQGVAAALQGGAGQAIPVEVLRRGEKVALAVTPRSWSGRGLLGCHIRPL